jgi:hypothetical protein
MPQTYYLGARSLFVTLLAWGLILLAALACTVGVVQQASLASYAPGWQAPLQSEPLPVFSGWLVAYLPWVNGAGLLVSACMLAAAVGLLLRREWARRTVIGLLLLSIVANLAGLWLQHELVQSLVDSTLRTAPLPAAAAGVFGGFVTAAKLMGGAVTLFVCVGLGWMVRRLMSAPVLQEFAG